MRAMACKAAILCLLCHIVSASSLSGSPRRLLQQATPEHSRNVLQDVTSVNAGHGRSLLQDDVFGDIVGAAASLVPFVPLLLLKAHEENVTAPGVVAVGVVPARTTTMTAPFTNVKANGKRRLRDAGTSVTAGRERSLLQDPLTTVEGVLGTIAPFVPLLLLKTHEQSVMPEVVAVGVVPAGPPTVTATLTNLKANGKRRLMDAGDTGVTAGRERSLLQDPLTTVEGVLGSIAPFVPLLLLGGKAHENVTVPKVVAVGVDPAAATTVTAPFTNLKANGKRRLTEEVSVTGPLGVTVHLDTASGNGTVTAPYTTVDFGRRLQQQAGDRGRK